MDQVMIILETIVVIILTVGTVIWLMYWFWPWLRFEVVMRFMYCKLWLIITIDEAFGNDVDFIMYDILQGMKEEIKNNKLF